MNPVELFDRPDAAKEKPRLNPLRSEMRATLQTPGWRLVLVNGLFPTVRQWRSALVWNPTLEQDDRIALQRAMALCYEGLKAAYEKAQLDIPSWLQKEFTEE